MKIKEIITEAKVSDLNQNILDQVFATYTKRDINDNTLPQKFTDGTRVAEYIYQHVGSKYLLWVVKQYVKDQYLFLHDLPAVKDTLDKFIVASRGRIPIEKDINRYESLSQLRTEIEKVTNTVGGAGSGYFKKAIDRIDKQVHIGNAIWLYKGSDYVIYQPLKYEASKLMSTLISTNICTIMQNAMFDDYSETGTLMYTIPNTEDKKLYNCFISADSDVLNSEAADEQNRHEFDIEWQIKKFPALLPLVKKSIGKNTDLYGKLSILDDAAAKYKVCMEEVKRDGARLQEVPEELLDYDLCFDAVTADINSDVLQNVPLKFRDYDLCMAAVSVWGYDLEFVPQKLRDYDMCAQAMQSSGEGAWGFVPLDLKRQIAADF